MGFGELSKSQGVLVENVTKDVGEAAREGAIA
jgi:hypothetical protein